MLQAFTTEQSKLEQPP